MTPVAQMGGELVQIELNPRKPVKKPEWLKAKAPMGETFHALEEDGARTGICIRFFQ